MQNAIAEVNNAKELEKTVQNSIPELNRFNKGSEWGESLVKYAINSPRNSKNERPIISQIEVGFAYMRLEYHYIRNKTRVDPISGESVERNNKTN